MDQTKQSISLISLQTLNRILAGTILICIVGMALGTFFTLTNLPPVPDRVETEGGTLLFIAADISAGKEVFLKYNLMSYGTLLGNGAYYGPDYTAEYLHLVAEKAHDHFSNEHERLRQSQPANGVLKLPSWWAEVHAQARKYYEDFYVTGNIPAGVGPCAIPTVEEAQHFTDFVAWSAWISLAKKPGSDGSYTNNWPYEPALGNVPTSKNLFWSAATIAIVLLLAAAIVLAYEYLSVQSIPDLPAVLAPGEQNILPGQKAALPLFAIASVLFLIQTFAGGFLANAFASREDFYGLFQMLGLQRAVVFPFAAMRSVHVDLSVLWVIGMWMASALFVAPFLGGIEKTWLKNGTRSLAAIILVSVIGSIIGIYLATRNLMGKSWFWLGTEGTEYVDMGRI